jgi:hypothetical protein
MEAENIKIDALNKENKRLRDSAKQLVNSRQFGGGITGWLP